MGNRTITEKFQTLIDNLRTDNDATISARCRLITKRLNLDFRNSESETANTRYIGSYGRGTDIKGFSDVDLLAVLPYDVYTRYNGYQGNGQSALLQAVKNSILKTYSTTDVGGDGQVVVVNFSDGTRFEVLPAFVNTDKSYTHPDSNGGGTWKTTNPVPEIEAINSANKNYGGKVKHLAQMARAWKKKNSVSISGHLIDTFAHNFMKDWVYNDKSFLYYDYMTRDFLKYLSDRDPSQSYWSAPGSGQRVNRKGKFEAKAKTSYDDALTAIKFEDQKLSSTADIYWKSIFGSFFTG